ncbi:PH domain-containing protein [Natrialbaceae archaeon A-arb3/5]
MAFSTTPDWFHISDDEDVVWESRPHPVSLGVGTVLGIVGAFVGLFVTSWGVSDGSTPIAAVGAVVLLASLGVVLARYLVWTNTRYVLTSSELYKKYGVISRDVTQFRLDRVQNTSLQQTMVGRALGYGDLTVYTAGSGDPELTFERVPRPEHASSLLSEQLENADTTESPV